MTDILIYLFIFTALLLISENSYKIICFIIVSLLTVQLILTYYTLFGLIQDPLFYLVLCSFLDLILIFCVIVNNIHNRKYHICMSIIALVAVFVNILTIFDYCIFYYFQYSYLIIMEYVFFTINYKNNLKYVYYLTSLFLILPHILT